MDVMHMHPSGLTIYAIKVRHIFFYVSCFDGIEQQWLKNDKKWPN